MVVETGLEGCVLDMCEVGGKVMGWPSEVRERERLAGAPHRGGAGLGWSPHAAGPMAPTVSVARKLS